MNMSCFSVAQGASLAVLSWRPDWSARVANNELQPVRMGRCGSTTGPIEFRVLPRLHCEPRRPSDGLSRLRLSRARGRQGVWHLDRQGSRVSAQALIDNARDGFSPENIADMFEGLPVDRVRAVLRFAGVYAPTP